jgi:hypothetical protein
MRRAGVASSRGGVVPLDDAGGDSAAVAQVDRVAGVTDPGPGRLIRRTAAEIVVEGDGCLGRRRGRPAGDGLPARCRLPVLS